MTVEEQLELQNKIFEVFEGRVIWADLFEIHTDGPLEEVQLISPTRVRVTSESTSEDDISDDISYSYWLVEPLDKLEALSFVGSHPVTEIYFYGPVVYPDGSIGWYNQEIPRELEILLSSEGE